MRIALANALRVLATAVVLWAALASGPLMAKTGASLDRAIAGEILALAPDGEHRNYTWKKQVIGKWVRIRGNGPKGKIDAKFKVPKQTLSGGSPGLIPVKIEYKYSDGTMVLIEFVGGVESRYVETKPDGTKEIRLFEPDGSFKTVTVSSDGSYYQEVCNSDGSCEVTTGEVSDDDSDGGGIDSDLADEVEDSNDSDSSNGPGQGAENGKGGGNGQGAGGGTGGGSTK